MFMTNKFELELASASKTIQDFFVIKGVPV